MQPVSVLVIGDGADTTLICAALAKQPEVRVVDVPHARQALKLLQTQSAPMALAIAGAAALRTPELLNTLEASGVPLVGIAAGLSQEVKQRALAAGVKEIHDRPRDWQAYSELIEAVIRRFTQVD
jgi:CheY-like chemotaxis protein